MKIKFHSLINRCIWIVLAVMLAVGVYYVTISAKTDELRIFGYVMMVLVTVAYPVALFVFRLGLHDYAVFRDTGVEMRSPFRKPVRFEYSELIGCQATYYSVGFKPKRYLTFTDKKLNAAVRKINTSTHGGNLVKLRKMKVIFVPYSKELVDFLVDKQDLLWYF